MWAVEIANTAGPALDARPALLVAANFEGDQLIGSELALYLARHLATSYANDAQVKKLLDDHAVYILPRVNPDGAELMFGKVKSFRRTNARKVDDDNDGRVDEDGPEDLNGDGFISVMRVKDPKGPYMAHPDDARLLRRADAQRGEAGGWSVYWEGTDNDGDGFINEDGPGGVDLNRNFQHRYPYYTADAGPHMVSEPETRAVMDYILKKKNVAAVLTYGASDNLITAPTRQGALAAPQTLDLLAFADQSVADARRWARSPAGRNSSSSRGGGRGGDGAPPQTRPPGQPAPRPPATTVATAGRRVLPHRQRPLSRVDGRDGARRPHARPAARSSSTPTTSSACRPSRRPGGAWRPRLPRLRAKRAQPPRGRSAARRCLWRRPGSRAGRSRWRGAAGERRRGGGNRGVRCSRRAGDRRRVHRVDAVHAPHARRGRDRRLQTVCGHEPARLADRGARQIARGVRGVPRVAVPEDRDCRRDRDVARRRSLSDHRRGRECRLPADVHRARRDVAQREADDGAAWRRRPRRSSPATRRRASFPRWPDRAGARATSGSCAANPARPSWSRPSRRKAAPPSAR